MKASQAARILNARKHLGHRCWRYVPTERGHGQVETYRRCNCGAEAFQFSAIEAIAAARYHAGEIDGHFVLVGALFALICAGQMC